MEGKNRLQALLSGGIGLVASLLCLLLFALIALRLPTPAGFLTASGYGALVLGALICGVLQGRAGDDRWDALIAASVYGSIPAAVSLVWGGAEHLLLRMAIYLGMAAIAWGTAELVPKKSRRRRYRY